MSKESISPPELFASRQYGYSQVIAAQGSRMIFMSGQVAWDAQQKLVGPDDLGQQMRQALRNVETAVRAAGGTLDHIVSMRIYVLGEKLSEGHHIREALLEFFPGEHPPTTTWIGVQALASKDFLVEIEPIAVID